MAEKAPASPPRGRRSYRRRSKKRRAWDSGDAPIDIRVGNRRQASYYFAIQATGPSDAARFRRMVDDTLRMNPRDPILIAINGYQPWLEDVLTSCIDDRWSELPELNRELQFIDTVKFPERSNKRTKMVPWSFIVDEMNLPEVYWWSFDRHPPQEQGRHDVDNFRFRIGVWTCGRGALRFDAKVPVTIIFTQPTDIAERVVTRLMFRHLYEDDEYDVPRRDEETVCWMFLRLYWLLTDWQNIIREIERELEEAEINSRGRALPVKMRTRSMHRQVARLYELKEYLQFHSRSFNKLLKLKDTMHTSDDAKDPVWDEIEDAVEDLDQYDYYLDSFKERFNNLITLEFNIESANQSDYSRFLSVIAAVYLPISYLASVFGITTFTGAPLLYLYIALPLLLISVLFTMFFPWMLRQIQRYYYPPLKEHLRLPRQSFTMLGDELPGNADVPRIVAKQERGAVARSRSRSKKAAAVHGRSRERERRGDGGGTDDSLLS